MKSDNFSNQNLHRSESLSGFLTSSEKFNVLNSNNQSTEEKATNFPSS